MDDNNFTYLEDIIDLDEPGNDNENTSSMYSHYSAPPNNMTTSHDFNSIRKSMSTQEMFNSTPRESLNNIQYLPKSERYDNRYGPYTPISKIEEDYSNNNDYMVSSHIPSINKINQIDTLQHPHHTSSGSSGNIGSNLQLTDAKVRELTDKYDELCYICKKLNDKDRIRYHYIYNIIIVFLFVTILLLVKKVLNI